MFDRPGLLHNELDALRDFQRPLAQARGALGPEAAQWPAPADPNAQSWSLVEIMEHAKPDILVGVSGVPGLFTEEAIRMMDKQCSAGRPIIFPLSNPLSRVEGAPKDIMHWTNFRALVATGTAFPPSEQTIQTNEYESTIRKFVHSQCNNSYVFPAFAAVNKIIWTSRVTDGMLMAAARGLAEMSPAYRKAKQNKGSVSSNLEPLLPPIEDVVACSKHITLRVAQQAIKEGSAQIDLSDLTEGELMQVIEKTCWVPHYKPTKLHRGADKPWLK
jgi:malate dehydrogenase (oxaloacetate-decarboxylating)